MATFFSIVCKDLAVPNSDAQTEAAIVNGLILDVGALEMRIELALKRLRQSGDHDSQMRHRAVAEFRDALLDATTQLRQNGLHPGSQGALW